jgi:hypothetical protein
LVHVRLVTSRAVKDRGFVTDRLVKVADVPTMVFTERVVMVEEAAVRALRDVIPVTARLVVVTLVDVTSPNVAFQRLVADPRLNARSVVGTRFEFTVPETMRVEVTVAFEEVNPPNSERVVVVKAPRFVTDWRVSASAPADGHPTPFDRQIPCPATVAVAKVPTSAYRYEEEAWLNRALVPVTEVRVESPVTVSVPVTVALEMVAPP